MDSNLHLEEYIDFNKYWQVLKRRWVPATATFAGIVALSVAAALASEKVYEAEAQLQIRPDRTSAILNINGDPDGLKGLTQDKDPLETEAKIFQSRPVIEKLIKELDLKSDSGKPLTYKNVKSSLKADPVLGTDILQITYDNPDPDIAVAVVQRAVELYSEDYASFTRSGNVRAKDYVKKELPKAEKSVREAEENLRLFQNRNRTANLNEETTATIGSISAVENEIDQVKAQLQDVDARYSRLKSQLGMTWQEASAVSSLSQSVGVQSTLEQLQKVKLALAQKGNVLSDSSPQIISLKEEQADLTALLKQQVASTLGSQQSLASSVNVLSLGELKQAQLANYAELGLQKEGLDQRLASLQNTYTAYQKRSDNFPQLQEQQRQLQRKVTAAQSAYEGLLSKSKELDVLPSDIDKVRVVANAAILEDPVNPSGKIIVAAGAMMGVLFGMALAFLLDLKDNTIKNTQEVENMFAYPLHGIVPNIDLPGRNDRQPQLPGSATPANLNLPQKQKLASEVSMMPLKEAYQNIQVNLKLLDADARKKVIAITSSVPQEGKSSVSANLAVARSECGQKILLVDADMRRPTQHHIWEISNQVGLIDILRREVQWEDAIQNTMPNLDVLTAGSIPNNPVALLDSPTMREFIDSVSKHYDQIIFDTPPINGIADTKIIGKLIDGFLFVVRPGVADYGSASAAKKTLDSTRQKVLGVIVNGADMSREPDYYNSYYYAEKSNK
ncbi:GumC family protein [Pleurocapsa sp. FMAR1]|uniref:GumC family protein n=1 Tax=Pleurocapsa sp. FMAR1 TaxID=3040204 RepID=UPI0029C78BE7|nr:polysaccharide biosynthesis tyrosine autokinase [Pleurocapsa sp. FMAR1]